ncbi:hypothetical protein QBC99_001827 [Beijerinckia sp. GAS462]|nr:hypothetical protein [Beijerinckia sp. GAS462]SEC15250.1 hypothetical protein SAMN05443249_2041 [Beijerinckia sp. 28-YEA-48]
MLEAQRMRNTDTPPHGSRDLSGSPSPALGDKEAGHLRRMRDLAARLPDDWSGMQGRSSMQEDFGALRFQLAYMSYALALTHIHRLPAAPAMFRRTFQQLIEKMLSPDVWTYWHYVSTGNGPLNKALGKLPNQWNPVGSDNIMYSAYIQSMTLLYHYLFRDDRYATPGALTFAIKPLFWGDGGEAFAYDERSLNEHIYWTMVEKGYLGIACEPNCVFQVCNQPAILGFRLHDLIHGGHTATEVTEGYKRAWADFGIVDPAGHYNILVQEKEHALVRRPPLAWADFWASSLMHAWNPAFVKTHYPAQMAHWTRPGPDGTLWIQPSIPPAGYGRELTAAYDHGWGAVCASEVGDRDTLDSLLGYADQCLTPEWDDGAFYYRRRDGWFDAQGRLAAMDPHTGNVLLGYARLNVPDGLRQLYDNPWGDAHFAEPALTDMPEGLDLRAARYDSTAAKLLIVGRRGRSRSGPIALAFANVWGRGDWTLHIDGALFSRGDAAQVIGGDASHGRREGDDLLVSFDPDKAFRIEMEWQR